LLFERPGWSALPGFQGARAHKPLDQPGSGFINSPLTPEMQQSLTPETAIDMLDTLPWHIYGGSYFGPTATGAKGEGSIRYHSLFLR
jgi:hypothetical protein